MKARANAVQTPPPAAPPGSPLDGHELQAIFGLPPGPWIAPIKAALDAAVQDGTLAPDDKAGARQQAAELLEAMDVRELTTLSPED